MGCNALVRRLKAQALRARATLQVYLNNFKHGYAKLSRGEVHGGHGGRMTVVAQRTLCGATAAQGGSESIDRLGEVLERIALA